MRKRSVRAVTPGQSTLDGVSGVVSKDVRVNISATPKARLPKYDAGMNDIAVWMECPKCGYQTNIYGQGDLDMWDDEKLIYPECPIWTCHRHEMIPLIKSKQQYREL